VIGPQVGDVGEQQGPLGTARRARHLEESLAPVLDAAEDALRLAFRLAGWTVSGVRPDGEATSRTPSSPRVVVESRDPEHHALRALVDWDQDAFWVVESELRRPLMLPPHRPAIRVETRDDAEVVARVRAHVADGDDLIGPLPLERGRIALLIRSCGREATLAALRPLRERASRDGIELRIDVDPVDLG
jgi:primosomal protein N'